MASEKSSAEISLAGRSRLSESFQLYQILHPSAATSPSGTGNRRGGNKSGEYWGWFNVATCFQPETVELLLPNAPGRCRAGGKNHECGTGRDELVECAKLGGITHICNRIEILQPT
jgi:hypothetical protein